MSAAVMVASSLRGEKAGPSTSPSLPIPATKTCRWGPRLRSGSARDDSSFDAGKITSSSRAASEHFSEQLWISFASLLRSHAAMRAIAQPAAGWQVFASSDASVEIEGCGRTLCIMAPDESGAGTVTSNICGIMDAGDSMAFFFTEDGRISFHGADASLNREDMEMEAAAEYVLDRVCS